MKKKKLGPWQTFERRVCIGTIIFILALSVYAVLVAPAAP